MRRMHPSAAVRPTGVTARLVAILTLLVAACGTAGGSAPAPSTPTSPGGGVAPASSYHSSPRVSLLDVTPPAQTPAPRVLTPHPQAVAEARAHPVASSGVRIAGPGVPTTAPADTPAQRNAALTTVSTGFAGTTHDEDVSAWDGGGTTNEDARPPDDNVGVSPTTVAEVVNSALFLYTRSGSLRASASLYSLLPDCWQLGSHTTILSDPVIEYDAATSRWYLTVSEFSEPSGGWAGGSCGVVMTTAATSAVCSFDITVSASCWYGYAFWYNQGLLYDQPKLGYSDDKIVIAWNDFNFYGGYVGEEAWVLKECDAIQTCDLSGGVPGTAPLHGVQLFNEDARIFGLVPAQSLSSTTDEWAVYNNSDPNLWETTAHPSLGMIRITGTFAASSIGWSEQDVPMAATSIPMLAPQPGSSVLIDTDDDRLLGASWRDGLLWTTANDTCEPAPGDYQACARFIEAIASGSATAVLPDQQWDLAAPSTDYYYPAATFDTAGDMVASVTTSSASAHPAVSVLSQAAGYAGGPNVTQQVQAGSVDYLDTRGNACSPADCARWGDYGGAAYDPSDPHGAWVVGEYVTGDTIQEATQENWATYIQDVEASGPSSGVSAPGGGYVLDDLGGLHPFGDAPPVTTEPDFGFDIARAVVLDPCDSTGHTGWVLDGWGGLTPFAVGGTAAPPKPVVSGYWPGWDIARDTVAWCATVNGNPVAEGCTLDGWGGLHAWAQTAAVLPDVPCDKPAGYWPGWDIANRITVIPGTDMGYVLDGFGGLWPFNGAPVVPATNYWPGWDIARDVVALPESGGKPVGGYVLDGYGGVHPYGGAAAVASSDYPAEDIVRAIDLASGGTAPGLYTLDGHGAVSPAPLTGGPPALSISAYWPGALTAEDMITLP